MSPPRATHVFHNEVRAALQRHVRQLHLEAGATLAVGVVRHGQCQPRNRHVALVLHDLVLQPRHHARLHPTEACNDCPRTHSPGVATRVQVACMPLGDVHHLVAQLRHILAPSPLSALQPREGGAITEGARSRLVAAGAGGTAAPVLVAGPSPVGVCLTGAASRAPRALRLPRRALGRTPPPLPLSQPLAGGVLGVAVLQLVRGHCPSALAALISSGTLP